MLHTIRLGINNIPFISIKGILFINLDYPWSDDIFSLFII